MKTNKKTSIKSKLGLAVAIGSLLVGTQAFGQTSATMNLSSSSTTFGGDDAIRITQSGQRLNDGTISRFTFDRLDDVSGGIYAGYSLAQVNVSIRVLQDNSSLIVRNNSLTTDKVNAPASGVITFAMPTFTLGAETFESIAKQTMTSSVYTSQSPLVSIDLSNITLDANNANFNNPDSEVSDTSTGFDITESRVVDSSVWDDNYDNTGSFNFDLFTEYTVGFTGSGVADLTAIQSIGNMTFFTEVEYIVIPEVGTLAMSAIALGSLGGIALLRRRKRA